MITLYLLLDIAIGDIRQGVMSPKQSLRDALEYHDAYPTLASILDIMDIVHGLGELPRERYIKVPFGFDFHLMCEHIQICSNSAYKPNILYESVSINDWFRYNGQYLSISNGLLELRRSLLIHCLKDNVFPLLDDYIIQCYYSLVVSLVKASR